MKKKLVFKLKFEGNEIVTAPTKIGFQPAEVTFRIPREYDVRGEGIEGFAYEYDENGRWCLSLQQRKGDVLTFGSEVFSSFNEMIEWLKEQEFEIEIEDGTNVDELVKQYRKEAKKYVGIRKLFLV